MNISLKSISKEYQEKISVVIPVYNEQNNIMLLVRELSIVLGRPKPTITKLSSLMMEVLITLTRHYGVLKKRCTT